MAHQSPTVDKQQDITSFTFCRVDGPGPGDALREAGGGGEDWGSRLTTAIVKDTDVSRSGNSTTGRTSPGGDGFARLEETRAKVSSSLSSDKSMISVVGLAVAGCGVATGVSYAVE